jgi:hypothetical protein
MKMSTDLNTEIDALETQIQQNGDNMDVKLSNDKLKIDKERLANLKKKLKADKQREATLLAARESVSENDPKQAEIQHLKKRIKNIENDVNEDIEYPSGRDNTLNTARGKLQELGEQPEAEHTSNINTDVNDENKTKTAKETVVEYNTIPEINDRIAHIKNGADNAMAKSELSHLRARLTALEENKTTTDKAKTTTDNITKSAPAAAQVSSSADTATESKKLLLGKLLEAFIQEEKENAADKTKFDDNIMNKKIASFENLFKAFYTGQTENNEIRDILKEKTDSTDNIDRILKTFYKINTSKESSTPPPNNTSELKVQYDKLDETDKSKIYYKSILEDIKKAIDKAEDDAANNKKKDDLENIKNIKTQSGIYMAIGFSIITLVVVFMTWCINKIWKLVKGWFKSNNSERKAIFGSVSTNPLNDPSNDNEVYDNNVVSEDLPDQYSVITKSIQDSFAKYKAYNEKTTAYYNNVKDAAPPDLMDPNVLLPSNDNW